MTVQRQAQADRDACDRLLKAIFDRGLGQRQIARVTCIPLSTVQRALQRVIYPYRQDRPIEDAPTWKKRRAQLESLAIDQLQRTRDPTAGTEQGQAPKSRVAPRKSRVTLKQDEGDPGGRAPPLPGHALEGGHPVAPARTAWCHHVHAGACSRPPGLGHLGPWCRSSRRAAAARGPEPHRDRGVRRLHGGPKGPSPRGPSMSIGG
jgi:hypothetical protein